MTLAQDRARGSSNLLPRFVAQFVDRMNGIFLSHLITCRDIVGALGGPRLHQPFARRASFGSAGQ